MNPQDIKIDDVTITLQRAGFEYYVKVNERIVYHTSILSHAWQKVYKIEWDERKQPHKVTIKTIGV